jgi:hypothetical protein
LKKHHNKTNLEDNLKNEYIYELTTESAIEDDCIFTNEEKNQKREDSISFFCALVWVIVGLYLFWKLELARLLSWQALLYFIPGTLIAYHILGVFAYYAIIIVSFLILTLLNIILRSNLHNSLIAFVVLCGYLVIIPSLFVEVYVIYKVSFWFISLMCN